MKKQLPFLNFSLRKVIESEPDSFKQAKIKIVLGILLFSLLKVVIVVLVATRHDQDLQIFRAGAVAILFLSLIKVLLYQPHRILLISHVIVFSGLGVIWSNLFTYSHQINIVTIQMVFMVTLTSYYLIGGMPAALYTVSAIFPVIFYIMTKERGLWHLDAPPQELASPGFELIILLNFLTFVLVHYLYYQAFYRNLNEKESLNQQLIINVREAKALAESRSLFLSTMSHELRTPLNGVIGMTHLLRDTALDDQKDNLDILEFSATNLLSMINDILDYNKSELDKIELEAIPVNLSALLQKICSGLTIKAAEKALICKLELDEILKNRVIITDPTRLTQIIYNLAGNAIKFTEYGLVEIKATVLNQSDDRMNIRFCIKDTGIGIATDRQEAIFDPFIQASSDTTRHYGGTGLGLAIVKRLLKLFGSSVRLESQLGNGSEFSFNIEFLLPAENVKAVPEFKVDKTSLKGLRLLIVDDNRVNILLLERLLLKWEIQTLVAVNGQEAVAKLATNTFDVVLMDIYMPIMDGYAATLAIRSLSDPLKAKVPIIALTASVSHNVYAKIKEVGMHDYLPKPFQADQLHEKLQLIYNSLN
jgi:signal transduction histidine kinase/ActR/RegA family two-component response regulator